MLVLNKEVVMLLRTNEEANTMLKKKEASTVKEGC